MKTANLVNPLTTNVPHHIDTSQLISNANQLTGFDMMGNGHKWVKIFLLWWDVLEGGSFLTAGSLYQQRGAEIKRFFNNFEAFWNCHK